MENDESALATSLPPSSRRQFLTKFAAVGLAALTSSAVGTTLTAPVRAEPTLPFGRRSRVVPPSNGVDDRQLIQAILDEGAGDVVFGAGQTWTVDSRAGIGGISPRSDTRIIVEEGAVLRVKPNADAVTRLIDIGRDGAVRNVSVVGEGMLLGDLPHHKGTRGEWGHLIHVTNGSANVAVTGSLVLKHAWGDGIYIGDGASQNYDVLVDGILVDDCRREGIAPFWVNGCTIRNCQILDIGSTLSTGPGSGIDCEPNGGQHVDHLTIEQNLIKGTSGCGIYISANPGLVDNLIVRDNRVVDCGRGEERLATYQTNGIHIAAISKPVLVGNIVEGSGYDGNRNGASGQIYLRSVASPVVNGGRLSKGLGSGLLITHCTKPRVGQILIERNQYQGIVIHECTDTILDGNQLSDNVQSGTGSVEHLLVQSSAGTIIRGNGFRGNKGYAWVKNEASSTGSLLEGNRGVGPAPTNSIADSGRGTVAVAGGVEHIR